VTTWAGLKAAVESTPSGSSVTFVLSPNFDCSDYSYSGEITISTGNVTVLGDGTICDAAQGGRFFSVGSGAQLNLDAMTLKNGAAEYVSRAAEDLQSCRGDLLYPCGRRRIEH
jgi:hypothetical protein